MKRAKWQIARGLAFIALSTLNVLLLSPPSFALDPSLDISQYAHNVWSFRSGFLNGAVYAIAQTPDGYLWFGTQSGVVRFDGARTVPLNLPPGQQLPSAAVGALLAARDGTLWIGTFDGLASWKTGRLTQHPELAHHSVIALLQDRDGTVWAGGFGSPTGKLCAIRGTGTTCYGDDGSLGAAVASLYQDADGSLWVGAATGLWRWYPGPPTRYLAEPISNQQALTQGDHASGVVVASDNVRQIVGTRVMEYPLSGVPSPLTAAHLVRDRNGGLWIGTNAHGLMYSYGGKSSLFTHSDGLSTDQVITLFEDREGTIWVATPDGLDQFRESPVGSLSVKDGLSNATATSVLAARDGSVWIGTADGLNRWKNGQMTVYRRRSDPGLPDDQIESMFEDERGRMWVSGFHGVAVFERERFTAVPSVPMGFKHAIAGDTHGGLWFSLWLNSNDFGLAHLVDGKIIEQVPWRTLGGGPGSGLVPEPDGGVWTGLLSGGIAHFRAGQIRNLPLGGGGVGTRRVLELERDRHGTLWAATENGLSRIANGRVATLTVENGLPCNTVHWIIEDDLSSYWLYTRCGVLRIARTEMGAWAADPKRTIQATTLDTTDGVRPVAILKGFRPSVAKSSDGKIWFENGDTVSFIDPAHIPINTLPPPVYIEQITADGRTYEATRGLRLPPHVRNLGIDYTALSLVAPHKVHFRYKLEGQDADWREVVNKREVQYSNLPPGNYRFRVTATNNSGVWNEKGAVLDFSIAPAYYQTNWFRALCAAIFLALLWAAYQLRVRQLQREWKQLRDVIDTIPGNVWSARPDGSVDFINRRWLEFSGVSLEEGLGRGWEAAVHSDDVAKFVEEWRTAVACGKSMESEARVRRADGQYRWLLIRNVPLRDERGKIVKWYGTSADIDDRMRAEEALRRSNRELRAISNCNQTLLRATDEQSLLQEICRIVCEEAGYRMAWVGYAEHDEAKSVRPAAWTGTDEGYLASLGVTWADTQHGWGPTGTAIRSGKSCFIQDFATDPRMATWRESALLRDFRSGIALPLKDEHTNAFGSLTIYSEQPNAFTAEEIRLLEELAGDLAFGIVTLRSRAERKRAEDALRESETRFRTFVDHAPDALFIYDFERGTIVDVNRQACESLGYTRQELIGTTALSCHLDSDRAQLESVAQRAAAGESVFDTHWHCRKDRSLFPVEVHTNQYWHGGRRFLLKVARDITERKRAEEALRRSEAYLAEGQRLSHTGSWALSLVKADRNYWSEEMFRIFGFEPKEGPPPLKRFLQRIHPEDHDRATKGWEKAFRGKSGLVQDFRTVLPDGTVRNIHIIGHPVLDGTSELVEYVGTAVDVTERKRADQERERLRQLEADLAHLNRVSLLGELAASISHELKQPITGAITSARACLRWLDREQPDLERARAAAMRIDKDGVRAGEIIDRLRALYKKTPPKRELVDVNEIIGEMAVMLRSEANRFGVSVRTDLAADVLSITADRVQLQQVLMNLMLNAIEAMKETGGVLTVKSRRDENGRVLISVSDTGVGLPPDKADQIFNAFFTTKPQGSGMGLAISRSIVASHGGRLWATPNDGRGATFQFTLPVQAEAPG